MFCGLALLAAIVALGLSIVPGVALGRPFPLVDKLKEAEPEREREWSLEIKGVALRFGKPDPLVDEAAQRQARELRLLRGFTIAAVCCALLGICLGPVGWVREKCGGLGGTAVGLSIAALLWQYLIVGIILGAAAAVILMLMANFSV